MLVWLRDAGTVQPQGRWPPSPATTQLCVTWQQEWRLGVLRPNPSFPQGQSPDPSLPCRTWYLPPTPSNLPPFPSHADSLAHSWGASLSLSPDPQPSPLPVEVFSVPSLSPLTLVHSSSGRNLGDTLMVCEPWHHLCLLAHALPRASRRAPGLGSSTDLPSTSLQVPQAQPALPNSVGRTWQERCWDLTPGNWVCLS